MFESKDKNDPRRPDFVSNKGIMIWKNLDKNKKEYLSIRIPLLNIGANCFQLDSQDIERLQNGKVEVEEEKVE